MVAEARFNAFERGLDVLGLSRCREQTELEDAKGQQGARLRRSEWPMADRRPGQRGAAAE